MKWRKENGVYTIIEVTMFSRSNHYLSQEERAFVSVLVIKLSTVCLLLKLGSEFLG